MISLLLSVLLLVSCSNDAEDLRSGNLDKNGKFGFIGSGGSGSDLSAGGSEEWELGDWPDSKKDRYGRYQAAESITYVGTMSESELRTNNKYYDYYQRLPIVDIQTVVEKVLNSRGNLVYTIAPDYFTTSGNSNANTTNEGLYGYHFIKMCDNERYWVSEAVPHDMIAVANPNLLTKPAMDGGYGLKKGVTSACALAHELRGSDSVSDINRKTNDEVTKLEFFFDKDTTKSATITCKNLTDWLGQTHGWTFINRFGKKENILAVRISLDHIWSLSVGAAKGKSLSKVSVLQKSTSADASPVSISRPPEEEMVGDYHFVQNGHQKEFIVANALAYQGNKPKDTSIKMNRARLIKADLGKIVKCRSGNVNPIYKDSEPCSKWVKEKKYIGWTEWGTGLKVLSTYDTDVPGNGGMYWNWEAVSNKGILPESCDNVNLGSVCVLKDKPQNTCVGKLTSSTSQPVNHPSAEEFDPNGEEEGSGVEITSIEEAERMWKEQCLNGCGAIKAFTFGKK